MTDTIFGKILDGTIPCHRVYEDEHVLAFLDVGPLSPGHTLVIPKERVAGVHELSEAAAAALGAALPKICRAVMSATGCTAYNLLVNTGKPAGQEVMHVHLHVIPKTEDGGLEKRWTPGKLGDEDAAELVGKMRAALGG